MTTITCQRCGQPMPPLPDELAAMLQRGTPVQIVHEKCPLDSRDPEPDPGRYFEVRTQIVEVISGEPATDVLGARLDDGVTVAELVEFRFGVRAPDLAAAMRPLADGLGQKWLQAEEHAAIADPPQAGAL